MSREDPQFKLRMPAALRAQAERAAKAAGRSLNAELVSRIEASYIAECGGNSLVPADRARELALLARAQIPTEIRKRAIEAIGQAIKLGHSTAIAHLSDLRLDPGIPDQELDVILKSVIDELESAGYKVNFDDISTLWIEF